jgi:hypothetical protein
MLGDHFYGPKKTWLSSLWQHDCYIEKMGDLVH